ncbi:YqxA family protein [Alkalihalobacillus sp. LMS39]|uniref:YqxA family protein n=1 Tax=Alkalihalobacillus sp. LMS39 TaxID=2924032 RepID=UPI001FB4F9F2|nr:YqxA family protein [Alkalihalobacillus sp. LMS39]UOE95637.1 YqxA family protein [Alkalihalobacillus sp. LMS39]
MKKITIQAFLIASILLFGVLFGFHQANGTESKKIDVTSTEQKEETIKTEPTNEKKEESAKQKVKKEASQDGREELVQKQQRIVEVEPMNFYSELGSTIGESLESIFFHVVAFVSTTIHSLLNE